MDARIKDLYTEVCIRIQLEYYSYYFTLTYCFLVFLFYYYNIVCNSKKL